MGPDPTETPRATGCPSCGAALRPGAPWCTLCYADLRPEPAAPVEAVVALPATPGPTASYGVAAGDPLTQPLLAFLPATVVAGDAAAVEVTWPCSRCETSNPMSAAVCSACGGAFLAALRAEHKPLLVLPVVGDIGALTRLQRTVLALGLVLAVVLPLALVTLLTGSTDGGNGSGGVPGSGTSQLEPGDSPGTLPDGGVQPQ